MMTRKLSTILVGIGFIGALTGCIEPVVYDEPVATATTSISTGDTDVTAASSNVEINSISYLCRYLCPEVPKIFNGIAFDQPAQACVIAQNACAASGCSSCEFFELIER